MTDAEQVYSRDLSKVLLSDLQIDSLFCIAAAVSSYIHSLKKICGVIPSEAAEDLAAFGLLCLEVSFNSILMSNLKQLIYGN